MFVNNGMARHDWDGMTRPPGTRGPLGVLLDDAKDRSKQTWRDIERGSGIPVPTIQSWINGSSAEPPLRAFVHLALYLGITPGELIEAATAGYQPPLPTSANGLATSAEPDVATNVDLFGDRLGARAARQAGRVRGSQAKRKGRGEA